METTPSQNIAKIEQIQRRATKYILNYGLQTSTYRILPLMFWYELLLNALLNHQTTLTM